MPSILGALARSRRDAQSHCLQRYLARKPKVSPIPCCSASRTRGPGPFEHRQHVCVCPRRPGRQRPPGTWLAGPSAGFEGMAEKCGAFTTWCWQAPRMRRSSSQRGYGKLRKQAGTRQAAELALGGLDYQLFRFGSAFERLEAAARDRYLGGRTSAPRPLLRLLAAGRARPLQGRASGC
jgi:hypothetical protein